MALLADDARDRAEQILTLTARLTALIEAETPLIIAGAPLPQGPEAEEKARLVNVYRQEMARIAQSPAMLVGIAPALKDRLKAATTRLQSALARHEQELAAVKAISEGLTQAIAEAVARARGGPDVYTAAGGYAAKPKAGSSITLNQKA